MNIIAYSTVDETDTELAEYIRSIISRISEDRDDVIIALSGGSTPINCYKLLAAELMNIKANIHIIQVDERYVSPEDDRSNQKMIANIFSDKINFLPMVTPKISGSLEEAVKLTTDAYHQLLLETNHAGPDVTILGMGTDGHTASLFPNNRVYLNSTEKDLVIGMHVSSQPEPRISLTAHVINNSTHKILYAHGEKKIRTLQNAIASDNRAEFPILSVTDQLTIFSVITPDLYPLSDTWKLQNYY